MIDPTELDDLTRLLALLHDVDPVKLNHPVSLYMEPEEAETFKEFYSRNVKTVGDFLIWTTYYGVIHDFETDALNKISLSKVLEQIKSL